MKEHSPTSLSFESRVKISLAGATASAVSVLPGQPLDVLKTYKHAEPTTSYSTFIQRMKLGGNSLWRSLYAGLGSKMSLMTIKGLYRTDLMVTIPNWIEENLPKEFVNEHKMAPTLLSIAPITAVDVLIRTPMEAANRLRMLGGTNTPWETILRQVARKPYAETFPTATKDFIGWGIFLGVDESVKLYVKENCPPGAYHLAPLISTAIVSAIKTYITNPLDIIITSIQKEHLPLKEALYRVKAGGPRAACAGAIPRLAMSAADAYIGSSLREWGKTIRNEEDTKATPIQV